MIMAVKRLIENKNINEITISELAKTAGISRTTFYRNYNSLIDILTDYFERYPFGAVSPDEYSLEGFDLRKRLLSSFRFLKENKKLLDEIIKADQALIIYDNYNKLMKGLFRDCVYEMGFQTKYEMSAAAGLYFGICYDWILGDMKESVEQMADTAYHILSSYHKP